MKTITLKDFPNYTIREDGNIVSKKFNRILKWGISHNGYAMVILQNNGTRKTVRVNRLIAQCFVENPQNKPTVNHKDGNKLNNHAENLEWLTYSENTVHSFALGLQKYKHGEKTNFAKLTWDKVKEIRRSNEPLADIAKRYDVSVRSISRILKKETWTQEY